MARLKSFEIMATLGQYKRKKILERFLEYNVVNHTSTSNLHSKLATRDGAARKRTESKGTGVCHYDGLLSWQLPRRFSRVGSLEAYIYYIFEFQLENNKSWNVQEQECGFDSLLVLYKQFKCTLIRRGVLHSPSPRKYISTKLLQNP